MTTSTTPTTPNLIAEAVSVITRQAKALVLLATNMGVTVRITQVPRQPLAMGHHDTAVEAWPELRPQVGPQNVAAALDMEGSINGFNEWFKAEGYDFDTNKDLYAHMLCAWHDAQPDASPAPTQSSADFCADKDCGTTCTDCSSPDVSLGYSVVQADKTTTLGVILG